jgi:hypothetical protein
VPEGGSVRCAGRIPQASLLGFLQALVGSGGREEDDGSEAGSQASGLRAIGRGDPIGRGRRNWLEPGARRCEPGSGPGCEPGAQMAGSSYCSHVV